MESARRRSSILTRREFVVDRQSAPFGVPWGSAKQRTGRPEANV